MFSKKILCLFEWWIALQLEARRRRREMGGQPPRAGVGGAHRQHDHVGGSPGGAARRGTRRLPRSWDDVGVLMLLAATHGAVRRHHGHARPPRGPRPAVGRMGRRLLVARVDEAEAAVMGGQQDRVEVAAVAPLMSSLALLRCEGRRV